MIDRFWAFGQAEPVLLVLLCTGLFAVGLACWWIGWRGRNHLVGVALAVGIAFWIGDRWATLKGKFRRPTP